jgi:predicted enzyme related to lactoylglutathione lyase
MIDITKPGAPCWLDIGSPDLDATSAFYRKVLGWEFESAGPEAGGYGMYLLDGKRVAAGGPFQEEGQKSGWIIYFQVRDVDAATEAVQQAGGVVRVAPMDVMEAGRMAQVTDPTGGEFALWQAAETTGVELISAPGALTWVELYTADGGKAQEFYRQVFDWTATDMPIPGDEPGVYRIMSTGPNPMEDGHGGIMELPADQLNRGTAYWSPVFHVTDCDAAAAKVTEGGGTLQLTPTDMEGVGRVATCLDPFGASFSLLDPAD